MEVRITYRSEIYIKGRTLDEIKAKFEILDLDPNEAHDKDVTDYGFIEVVSVEDAKTYEDLMDKFK
jgi:hypothetical protein